MASKTERVTIRLPAGFDRDRHAEKLLRLVSARHGDGFQIESIDPTAMTATASRRVAVMEVHRGATADEKEVRLPSGTKPSDGDKVATQLADQFDGFQMTRFEPFLGTAVVARLSPAEARCRGASAVALGVKPWDVQVRARSGGGFELDLPKSYVPSRHDDRLTEVATRIVGQEGWYLRANPSKLTAALIPSSPPTFPPAIPYPVGMKPPRFDPAGDKWARIPIGRKLGPPGESHGEQLATNFVACPSLQVSGTAGSGKGVFLTSLAAGALAHGWQLGIVDAVKSGVDYVDLRPFVKPGFWAEDPREAVCVLQMTYHEGVRRKKLIRQHGVQKFSQLPAGLGIRPLMLIVDEATSLLLAEPVPKGVPKDHPLALEIGERNLLKATALDLMGKIPRELRFAGVSLVMASQVASSTVGIPTELRTNMSAKVLLAPKTTDNNRRLALSDPDRVPRVPSNIADDDSGAAKGSGVYEFEGRPPGVFKAFFSPPAEIAGWLQTLGLDTCTDPSPSAGQVNRNTPSLADGDDGGGSPAGRGPHAGDGPKTPSGRPAEAVRNAMGDDSSWELDPETGKRLTGYAKANAARAAAAVGG